MANVTVLDVPQKQPVTSTIPGMHSQPVITITTITTAVSAMFGLAVVLWPDLDPNLEKTIIALITAMYPVVTAAWTWHRVYSPKTVEKIADQQYRAGTPPTDPQPDVPPPANT